MNLAVCQGSIENITGNVARCSDAWLVMSMDDILRESLNSTLPTPEGMLLAFGAGIAVMVPIYAALWGIRAARDTILKS